MQDVICNLEWESVAILSRPWFSEVVFFKSFGSNALYQSFWRRKDFCIYSFLPLIECMQFLSFRLVEFGAIAGFDYHIIGTRFWYGLSYWSATISEWYEWCNFALYFILYLIYSSFYSSTYGFHLIIFIPIRITFSPNLMLQNVKYLALLNFFY